MDNHRNLMTAVPSSGRIFLLFNQIKGDSYLKAVRLLFAFILVFYFFPFSAFAAEKTMDSYYLDDVDYDHWAYKELEEFLYADIIDGTIEYRKYSDDEDSDEYVLSDQNDEDAVPWITIRPEANVTRAQFTKILVNAMDLQLGTDVKTFTDVKPADWFYNYVNIASSQGIITGSDGKFEPYQKITRQQMAAMIYRAFKPTIPFNQPTKIFKDVPTSSYTYEAIHASAANGIINGYGDSFKPFNLATRAQAVVMIYRALHQEPAAESEKAIVVNQLDQMIQEEFRLKNSQDLEPLETFFRQTSFGVYRAYNLEDIEMFRSIKEEGGTYSVDLHDDQDTFNVTSISLRYATVEVKNQKYTMDIVFPDSRYTFTEDNSAIYHLKKDANGNWKIYDTPSFDEEEGITLAEEVAAIMK